MTMQDEERPPCRWASAHLSRVVKQVRANLPALPSVTRFPILPVQIISNLGVERKEKLGNRAAKGVFFLSGFTKG